MRKDLQKQFGRKVRDERLKLGLSQEELAFKADVHRTYIGMIERGEKNVSLKSIQKIASALGLRLVELFRDL